MASFDDDPHVKHTEFDIEKCSLEMDNTKPLEGESKGCWITCVIRILMVEAEDEDPFKRTRRLELLGSKANPRRKIWQLCKCSVGFSDSR